MTDQPPASRLAREAFEHWQTGRLHESAELYAEALALADPKHYALADYHGEYACVLEALGRSADALSQLESAAAVQRQLDGSDVAPGTTTARYFLAEYLVRHNQAERALAEIASSLVPTKGMEWLFRAIEVEALAALNRPKQAQLAMARALEAAPSAVRREELARRFAQLGGQVGPVA